MNDFDLERIVYEIKFNSKWEIAKNVIAELEKLEIPFLDFLEGIGIYMDENLKLSKPASLVQKAHYLIQSTNRYPDDTCDQYTALALIWGDDDAVQDDQNKD